MERVRSWAPKALTILAFAVLVFLLGRSVALFLNYNRELLMFPYNVDYGEGPVLDQVMRLSRFENIYPNDITAPPYIVGNYPPMYHLLQLPFAWIFGPAFWYGRVINVVFLLAAAYFIGASLHVITKDWVSAIVGGAMLLTIPFILKWSGFVRVDSVALGFSWAALYCIIRRPDSRKHLIMTAALLTAAVFTRQSYGLAAPFAAFVWLLSHKPRKRAFELAAWTAGFSLAFFLLLLLLSGGGAFFNIVTANVNPFFWTTVQNYWQQITSRMWYLVISSLFYVLLAVWFKQKIWWVAAPYFLASIASGATIGKDGSNVNYLFELSAALAFLAGAVLASPGITFRGKQWAGENWVIKCVLMVLLAVQVAGIYPWARQDHSRWELERVRNEREEISRMVELVRQAEGPVLADEFMGLVVLGGQELVFQPFEYKMLENGGLWDQRNFVNAIFAKEYDMILLFDPAGWDSQGARWTTAQLEAIRGNYREVDRLANTLILVPREPLVIP